MVIVDVCGLLVSSDMDNKDCALLFGGIIGKYFSHVFVCVCRAVDCGVLHRFLCLVLWLGGYWEMLVKKKKKKKKMYDGA